LSSNTQRTLKALRDKGLPAGMVERFLPHAMRGDGFRGVRQDLFGFIDIVALDTSRGIIGIQSTGQDFSGHYRKIVEEKKENAINWIACGGIIELWAWRKVVKKRGSKVKVWQPRIHVFGLTDLIGF
jgi:hypothetical protein